MNKNPVWLQLGPLGITEAVLLTWALMLVLGLFCWLATRRLQLEPTPLQSMLEGIVSAIEDAITNVLPNQVWRVLPFIGTLWIYILCANLIGLIPGLSAPTANLSVTAGLALMVFLSVHWFGLRGKGWREYLQHYFKPSPILFPFHVMSEISRTIALAVRLFGNMMSLEMAALLVLLVAGLFAPVPLLMLHIVEAIVQAYIFGMLALIYVSGALQSQEVSMDQPKGNSHA